MVSSSRPENPLPSNSQGIWGDGFKLPWNCDYKSNINYEMNYWMTEPSNLSECHLPMLNYTSVLVKPGSKTARAYFNAPGWVLAMMTNAWGWTNPGEAVGWGSFFGAGGWVSRHLWEQITHAEVEHILTCLTPILHFRLMGTSVSSQVLMKCCSKVRKHIQIQNILMKICM